MKEHGYDLHIGSGRGFAAPAGIPRDAQTVLEETVARIHKSTGWKEYMARNYYEDVYLNADDYAKHLAARNVEMMKFLTEVGLAQKKP
jgi:putative tricarboxylic transport membrane protein